MSPFRFSRPFLALALPVMLALPACVPAVVEPPSPEVVARKSPVEPAETAYLSRADGPHKIPAVPLEKLPVDYRRQEVAYQSDMPPGSIVIHPGQKFLYFITEPGRAIRYGISVGRQGFDWAGEAVVSQTRNWPTWTPPPEMIERDPKLSKWENGQPGGPTNPLGARAIYLLSNGRDYGYRIHGTPDWWSIGKRASSGCIRMIHQDVIDLNTRVQRGAQVLVLNADGTRPPKLRVPPPAPVKKKPKPAEDVATPAVATPSDASATPAPASLPAPAQEIPAGPAPTVGGATSDMLTGPTVAPATPQPPTSSATATGTPPAPAMPLKSTPATPVLIPQPGATTTP
ncbi:MAG: L,D-transpeptidase family protein [Pseudorhodobacter sp.]